MADVTAIADTSVATSVTDYLIQQGGVFGIVIILMLAVLWLMWRKLEDKDKTHAEVIAAKDAIILNLQDKRVMEARESISAINSNTTALSNLTNVFTLLSSQKRD